MPENQMYHLDFRVADKLLDETLSPTALTTFDQASLEFVLLSDLELAGEIKCLIGAGRNNLNAIFDGITAERANDLIALQISSKKRHNRVCPDIVAMAVDTANHTRRTGPLELHRTDTPLRVLRRTSPSRALHLGLELVPDEVAYRREARDVIRRFREGLLPEKMADEVSFLLKGKWVGFDTKR